MTLCVGRMRFSLDVGWSEREREKERRERERGET
jgi:hypothetical protein